jgi:hypothetical protein
LKIPAIEIATREPLAGRLPVQAKARVRAGGRPAATPAGADFNRQIFHPSWRAHASMNNSLEDTRD